LALSVVTVGTLAYGGWSSTFGTVRMELGMVPMHPCHFLLYHM